MVRIATPRLILCRDHYHGNAVCKCRVNSSNQVCGSWTHSSEAYPWFSSHPCPGVCRMGSCGLVTCCDKVDAFIFVDCVQNWIQLVSGYAEDVTHVFLNEITFQNLTASQTSHVNPLSRSVCNCLYSLAENWHWFGSTRGRALVSAQMPLEDSLL